MLYEVITFDATVTPHYHIRCSSCGRVNDIDIAVQEHINEVAEAASNYKILGHHIRNNFV